MFRIGRLNIGEMMVQKIIRLEVIGNREGKWIRSLDGLKRYRRKDLLRKVLDQNIVAARDCIKRAIGSSWWNWCDGFVLSFGCSRKIIGCRQEMVDKNSSSRTYHRTQSHSLQLLLSLGGE